MRTVVILGMHRSGTSAMVRALGLLGAEMGPENHLGKHWENRFLRNVNVRLLDAAGGIWDAPPPNDGWLDSVNTDGLERLARGRFKQEYGDADLVVWKDPRTCLTLPFWRPIIGDDPLVVLIHRHPYEVARSLEVRNRYGPGLSYALWERYNADALRFANGLPTTVIKYADLVDRPQEVMTNLTGHLRDWGVDLPNDPATTDTGLQASERHHVSDRVDVLDHPLATDSQRAVFDLLTSLDGPHASLSTVRLPEPHPLSTELMQTVAKLRRVRLRNTKKAASTPGSGGRRSRRSAPST